MNSIYYDFIIHNKFCYESVLLSWIRIWVLWRISQFTLKYYFKTNNRLSFWGEGMPHYMACGILVPWPGIKSRPVAVKAPSPNHWTTSESPRIILYCHSFETGSLLYMQSTLFSTRRRSVKKTRCLLEPTFCCGGDRCQTASHPVCWVLWWRDGVTVCSGDHTQLMLSGKIPCGGEFEWTVEEGSVRWQRLSRPMGLWDGKGQNRVKEVRERQCGWYEESGEPWEANMVGKGQELAIR